MEILRQVRDDMRFIVWEAPAACAMLEDGPFPVHGRTRLTLMLPMISLAAFIARRVGFPRDVRAT